MAIRSPRVPKYRHYKPKGLAVVRIRGKDHYLGRFGSEESKELYRRLIAEHLSAPACAGRAAPVCGASSPSLTGLVLAYWDRHVVGYYVKGGRPTSEQDN